MNRSALLQVKMSQRCVGLLSLLFLVLEAPKSHFRWVRYPKIGQTHRQHFLLPVFFVAHFAHLHPIGVMTYNAISPAYPSDRAKTKLRIVFFFKYGGCEILHQLVVNIPSFIGGLSGFNHPILVVFTSLQNPGQPVVNVSPESKKLMLNHRNIAYLSQIYPISSRTTKLYTIWNIIHIKNPFKLPLYQN